MHPDFRLLATYVDIFWLTFKLARQDTYSSINLKIPGWDSQYSAFCTLSVLLNLSCFKCPTCLASKLTSVANTPTLLLQNRRYSEAHLSIGVWGRTGIPVSKNQNHGITQCHIPTLWTSLTSELWETETLRSQNLQP